LKKILIKTLMIFCTVLLFVIPSQSIGDMKTRVLDGYYWSKQSFLWKLGFVEGWIEAGILLEELPIAVLNLVPQEGSSIKEIGRQVQYQRKIAKGFSKEKGVELYDLTFDQIVDTIDRVYSDPRVKTWEINEIMPLIRGRLKEGWTEKDQDEVIAYKIKEREFSKKFEKFDLMSESEKEKTLKEFRSLKKTKVLELLETY